MINTQSHSFFFFNNCKEVLRKERTKFEKKEKIEFFVFGLKQKFGVDWASKCFIFDVFFLLDKKYQQIQKNGPQRTEKKPFPLNLTVPRVLSFFLIN
jgi:hypothetical protein